jgi:hypothetical protein
MSSDGLIDAFMDAIREKLEVEEFERLMLGGRAGGVGLLRDDNDLFDLSSRHWDDQSAALAELKTSRALERLQGRYPALWEQAVMSQETADAS